MVYRESPDSVYNAANPTAAAEANPYPPPFSRGDNSVQIIRGQESAGAAVPCEFAGHNDLTIGADSREAQDAGDGKRAAQVTELCRALDGLNISGQHMQAVVVTNDDWNSPTGTMWLVDRKDGKWQPTDEHWPVDLGEHGMGWGQGLIANSDRLGSQKHEGDGKAPAGIFTLGTAFGYSENPPSGTKMPYKQATDHDYFIDDVTSPDYNKWVTLSPDGNDPRNHWKSFEEMHRQDNLYNLGVVVNHNVDPAVPGGGSAIFMHIWRGYGSGTAGCTAMSEDNMKRLMTWLNPTEKPLLVQLPSSEDSVNQLSKATLKPESWTGRDFSTSAESQGV